MVAWGRMPRWHRSGHLPQQERVRRSRTQVTRRFDMDFRSSERLSLGTRLLAGFLTSGAQFGTIALLYHASNRWQWLIAPDRSLVVDAVATCLINIVAPIAVVRGLRELRADGRQLSWRFLAIVVPANFANTWFFAAWNGNFDNATTLAELVVPGLVIVTWLLVPTAAALWINRAGARAP
jgi:hypothetical protein